MNKLLKTLLAPVLAIILVTSISLNVFADTYDRDAAIAYAKAHWDSKKEGETDKSLCAEFVCNCLRTGKLEFSKETDVIGRIRFKWWGWYYYYTTCWGLFHDLTSRKNVEMYTLEALVPVPKQECDSAYGVLYATYSSKLRKGDVIFYHIKGSPIDDTDQYYHVVIVCNDSDDKSTDGLVHICAHHNDRCDYAVWVDSKVDELVCIHFKD